MYREYTQEGASCTFTSGSALTCTQEDRIQSFTCTTILTYSYSIFGHCLTSQPLSYMYVFVRYIARFRFESGGSALPLSTMRCFRSCRLQGGEENTTHTTAQRTPMPTHNRTPCDRTRPTDQLRSSYTERHTALVDHNEYTSSTAPTGAPTHLYYYYCYYRDHFSVVPLPERHEYPTSHARWTRLSAS